MARNECDPIVGRRRLLIGAIETTGFLFLAGCDNLSRADWFAKLLGKVEYLTQGAQRLISSPRVLAKEFTEADLSSFFPPNGNRNPDTPEYRAMAVNGFADWTLMVDGLVRKPMTISLDDLRRLPSRTQITRHDCVEGWSAIGKWKGVQLSTILQRVEPMSAARYLVFYCADPDEDGVPYYESIDLDDAFHPQTLLAYEMNGETLPIAHGAPLRLRVERQLGYKHAKYIMRIALVENFETIGGGKGGYWEDQGYEWYAGI